MVVDDPLPLPLLSLPALTLALQEGTPGTGGSKERQVTDNYHSVCIILSYFALITCTL